MKFGIFYELQLPRPWKEGDEHRLYQNALNQIELADRLGYDHAWQVEHHFLEEYSHSPSPESFLAAASQRTKNIRLGHGIFQVTTNHPTRVAERVATLDLLSNGRCEFGMGESASITELEPFGVTMENKREIFEEAVRAILPMFKDGPSEHAGKTWNIPLRMVVPKPMQKPHPPLWVACSQLQTLTKAGEWGMGALGFQFVSADAAHAWVHAYYNAFVKRQKKLADYKTNPNIALVSFFMCAKTDEEARARADGDTFFQFALRFYGQSADRRRPPAGSPFQMNFPPVEALPEGMAALGGNPQAWQKAVEQALGEGDPALATALLFAFEGPSAPELDALRREAFQRSCP